MCGDEVGCQLWMMDLPFFQIAVCRVETMNGRVKVRIESTGSWSL